MRGWHVKRAATVALCVALLGCGDEVGPDATALCVEPAFEIGDDARIMAVYHAAEADEDPVVIDDVPLVDGRGCLTLRPPPSAWFEAVVPDPVNAPGLHRVEVPNQTIPGLTEALPPLRYSGVLIDLAVYADGDASGGFDAPDAAGVGPDRLRMRLSASTRASLPVWIGRLQSQLGADPAVVSSLFDTLAPGNQPFAVSKPTNAPDAWRGATRAQLTRWPGTFVLPPTAKGTWCDIGSAWPRCRSVTDQRAQATARLVDPRVPAEAMSLPFDGFDPAVNLPPGDAPAPPMVEARQCADVGAYRVARERTIVPRQDPDSCVCHVYVRTRWVVTLADDPPDWLACVGRPLSVSAGAALAAESGLNAGIDP